MKPLIVLPGLLLALTPALSGARAQAPPADWVDPATGHRVLRLSGDGGGSSLYFHQNTYTPRGDKLIFDTPAGIAAIDLTKLGKEPVKAELVVPEARAISTAWRRRPTRTACSSVTKAPGTRWTASGRSARTARS